jgi:protein-tyrosine phosphatase
MTDSEIERQGKFYFDFAKQMVSEAPNEYPNPASSLSLIRLPIQDKGIASDEDVLELVEEIVQRFKKGENIFIHCRGGHGRTGVVAALLLGRLYGLSAYESLELVQKYHDTRIDVQEKPGVYSSPETHEQRGQVYKLLS